MQCIEAVKLKEVIQASRVDLGLYLAVFVIVLHPELRRHGDAEEVAEVFSLAVNLEPVTQIFTRFASIVLISLQFVREPCRVNVDKA